MCSTPCGITEVGTNRRPLDRLASLVLNALRHHRGRHEGLICVNADDRPVLNALRHHRGRHQIAQGKATGVIPCSTPCGITEVGTEESPIKHVIPSVLNALRHHRGRHQAIRPDDSPPGDVLNALRHHRGRHIAERTVVIDRTVLNALRHHRGRHHSGTPRCLTVKCAQRLAASQRSARSRAHGCNAMPPNVLNALRHHRGRHPFPHDLFHPWPKVLNALRHHRGRHTVEFDAKGALAGAQRLAASQRSARRSQSRCPAARPVLNALRHHRGRHDHHGRTAGRSEIVLNALRHHRGRHPGCRPRSAEKIEVLNALRHHRGRHNGDGVTPSVPIKCSTPCGITEVGT